MDNSSLARLLFPSIAKTPADYEVLYPPRILPDGARVSRSAPSPTGHLHIGVLFQALVAGRVAHDSGGVFYTRIEDTDKKREVEGAMADIIGGMRRYGIKIDEGFVSPEGETGAYGPYKQSERREIYHTYVKSLVAGGFAYPCFCTEDELNRIRERQEACKQNPGYYGSFAVCRGLPAAEAAEKIRNGTPYVIRLRSPGNSENKAAFEDGIKGKIEMPENDMDIVLLKTDGIPTYHFAHAVDDHLMRTTHVIRGDEWLSSTPVHLQLFRVLGFKPPKYAHISPIMKEEHGSKRKLSKRKDPEAAVKFYAEQGYTADTVTEYLLTVANSGYEDWRRAHPELPNTDYPFDLKKMSVSGALFDLHKLHDVGRNVMSRMTAEAVLAGVLEWAESYDPDFGRLLARDPATAKAVFAIDRGGVKPRKDLAKFADAKQFCATFYEELFDGAYDWDEKIRPEDAVCILESYVNLYEETDGRDEWFAKIKALCPALGFCPDVKAYKQDPAGYKGHVGDVSTVIRVAVTGRRNTPDLCEIMRLLGKERVLARISRAIGKGCGA